MMEKRKGRAFLEIFASALQEDYRFPILELFAFLYALSSFVLAGFNLMSEAPSEELAVYSLVFSLSGLPLNIFLLLVFKNIAFGLGSDLEKGTVQTIFSYPLKRHAVLTAKLLSAIGVSLLIFFSAQMFALMILASDRILPYMHIVVLAYLANLSYPLLLAFIILFVTLLVRKGGSALVLGIVLSFLINVFSGVAQLAAWMTKSAVPLQILAVFNPAVALQSHYNAFSSIVGPIWEPNLPEVMLYVGAGYALVFFVLILSYDYFGRRLNL